MIQTDTKIPPRAASMLGYAGVAPFALLAPLQVFGHDEIGEQALRAFLAYGAVILSFLGGIRWGVATRFNGSRAGAWLVSVLPSLWAFFFLVWPDPLVTAWALLIGFAVMGLIDWLFPAPGAAPWMTGLRSRLTIAVVACHAVLASSLMTA